MKVYLAHNFAARKYLQGIIELFTSHGHEVTSRWITDDAHLLPEHAEQSAVHDLEDVEKCGYFILFTDQYSDRPGKGKFAELGYAIRSGKRIILVGQDDSCVFYNLPTIRRVNTIEEAIALL